MSMQLHLVQQGQDVKINDKNRSLYTSYRCRLESYVPAGVYKQRRNYERTGTPAFWTAGTIPHFSGRKGEEFAVTCCQQRRSADIKLQ